MVNEELRIALRVLPLGSDLNYCFPSGSDLIRQHLNDTEVALLLVLLSASPGGKAYNARWRVYKGTSDCLGT